MSSKDLWHFPRDTLAEQVLGLFESGLSSALVFFAPRRMGKTEFLRKDIQPLADKQQWKTFYFSFLDIGEKVEEEFTQALLKFAIDIGAMPKGQGVLSRVRKVSAKAVGIKADLELEGGISGPLEMRDVFLKLAKKEKVLLLMDEVQVLSTNDRNHQFIAGLRTALDLNKDRIKVIFTGSSREGLRRMFSQASAPFFHFGQNLPFPELAQEFTDHLAAVFQAVTQRNLDNEALWQTFKAMDKVPQLARSLVERLALNPNQGIAEAKDQLLADIFNDRAYIEMLNNASKLEQMLLKALAQGEENFFSESQRKHLAKELGIAELTVPSVQSALRVLLRKNLIGKLPDRGAYFIDDPNLKSWLQNLEH